MGQQAITVKVAGKSYPMTVEGPEEEETIRKAEKLIRERMGMYEKNYAITDVRDLLGMCVLQFATEAVAQEENSNEVELQLANRLRLLEESLNAALV
jgi:cell division protein ZapA (FtsZ GTPase activity inhibitor)